MDTVSLMASGSRTGRGRLAAVTETGAVVASAFAVEVGEIVFLIGVMDTIVSKIACRVVASTREGLELRFVAMTQETREALLRFASQFAADATRAARYYQPRFKVLPGPSRRVHQAWTPELRDTDRHRPASSRWLGRGRPS
ncbi:MAG: hypothetical protein FJZ01_06125 [Candidatus Sericytochromatia bacterium]|nr:hypothetical protein [Candidatus Tanganyikabacteria bacterium]